MRRAVAQERWHIGDVWVVGGIDFPIVRVLSFSGMIRARAGFGKIYVFGVLITYKLAHVFLCWELCWEFSTTKDNALASHVHLRSH